MPTIILLDAGPLGLVTNPKASTAATACNLWLEHLLEQRIEVVIPEIADYEVRRELLRAHKIRGLQRLHALSQSLPYAPISTAIMRIAAGLWAQARQQGRPMADPAALDADVILAATAIHILEGASDFDASEALIRKAQVIVATTGVVKFAVQQYRANAKSRRGIDKEHQAAKI